MRLVMFAALPLAALLAGGSAPKRAVAPFDGAWMTCGTYRGARICGYKLLAQRGERVCGVQSYFATSRTYVQRFVATANGKRARIDRICGDPGSETDTYCTGQGPSDAKAGWGTSDESLTICGSRLHSGRTDAPFSCASARPQAGLPKVRNLQGEGPQPEDQEWMTACLNGTES